MVFLMWKSAEEVSYIIRLQLWLANLNDLQEYKLVHVWKEWQAWSTALHSGMMENF